jgi:single-strand DNA-binding protein
MAKSLNKVMLIGNLGKDPEVRYTPSGVATATFSVATNESWKDNEGNLQERTEWHNIVVWRKLAEIAGEYLKKGKKIYLEGRIQTRSWDDKTTGQKRYMTEIVADNIIMLDSRGEGGGGGYERSQSSGFRSGGAPPSQDTGDHGSPSSSGPEEDLPF